MNQGLSGLVLLVLAVTCVNAQVGSTGWDRPAGTKDPHLTDKLVKLIQQKKYDAAVEELSTKNIDANQPDSKGRLPLLEAVKTRDIRFVDALLQYHALASAREPVSNVSPLKIAQQFGMTAMVRTLLAYGADPDGVDKAGEQPRKFTPTKEIADLLRDYDSNGAMAFEDEPGTWIRAANDAGHMYFYNRQNSESRWNTPPSCAWEKVVNPGSPDSFVNQVTGQTAMKIPPALAWRPLNSGGKEVWYNWKTNISQVEVPGELSPHLVEEAKSLKNVRWYNPQRLTHSWEPPEHNSVWRKVYDSDRKASYYINLDTLESSWEAPEELAWEKVDSSQTGPYAYFWYNSRTGVKQWHEPEPMSWQMHDTEL